MQDLHFHYVCCCMVETTDEIVAQRTQENYKRAYLLEQEQAVVIRLRTGCDFLMARANFTVLNDSPTHLSYNWPAQAHQHALAPLAQPGARDGEQRSRQSSSQQA